MQDNNGPKVSSLLNLVPKNNTITITYTMSTIWNFRVFKLVIVALTQVTKDLESLSPLGFIVPSCRIEIYVYMPLLKGTSMNKKPLHP